MKATLTLASLVLSLNITAQAAVLIQFENVGSNLRAHITGTLDLVGMTRVSDDTTGLANGVTATAYLFGGLDVNFPPPEYGLGSVSPSSVFDGYTGGSMVDTSYFAGMHAPNFLLNIASVPGDAFWMRTGSLMVPDETPVNGLANFNSYGYFEWTGRNTTSFTGTALLTTTPVTIWNNPNASGTAGAIQFALIPEPSSALFLALGTLGLSRLRSRRRGE